MNYKSKEDWVNEAFTVLVESGPSDLSVEKLSKRLGVTRGSFYHHFNSVNDFIDAVLLKWEYDHTARYIDEARKISDDIRDQLDYLIQYCWTISIDLEIAIRTWAMTNDHVKHHVQRIDEMRLQASTYLYQTITGDKKKGATLAKIAFYGSLGTVHALPRLTSAEMKSLILEVHNIMLNDLGSIPNSIPNSIPKK